MVAAGEIRVEVDRGLTVVRMIGEIDVALREQASTSMVAALTSDGAVVIDASALQSKSRNSPFDGRRLQGRVTKTIVGGRVVFALGQDAS